MWTAGTSKRPATAPTILNDYRIDFLRARHEKPFLLYLAHKAVHPELAQYADGRVSDASGAKFLPAEWHRPLYAGTHFPRRPSAGAPPTDKPVLEWPIKHLPPLGPATVTADETIRNRARMLQSVNEGIARMFRVLERSGRLDGTVFVLTSDEGYFFGEHGLNFERRLAYEESIRIPLLVRYPRLIQKGSFCDAFTLDIDLAPTVLELAGLERPATMQGRSLARPLKGQQVHWRHSFWWNTTPTKYGLAWRICDISVCQESAGSTSITGPAWRGRTVRPDKRSV